MDAIIDVTAAPPLHTVIEGSALCALIGAFLHPCDLVPFREEVEGVAGAFLIRNAFSAAEAAALCVAVRLAHAEASSLQQGGGARRNSQHHCALHVPPSALAPLGARLRALLPATAGPGSSAALAPPGQELSTFLRCYHYLPGDMSMPHWDKSFTVSERHTLKSFTAYSLLLYASDTCEGGKTTFFAADTAAAVQTGRAHLTPRCEGVALTVAAAVTPRVGDALVFPHGLHKGAHPSPLHEGSLVTLGEKILIRTDVVYA